jgi:hypothetical protein
MPSVNLRIKIIEENQALPIEASIENVGVGSKDSYREQTIKEYTTCENVIFYPVEIFREENR